MSNDVEQQLAAAGREYRSSQHLNSSLSDATARAVERRPTTGAPVRRSWLVPAASAAAVLAVVAGIATTAHEVGGGKAPTGGAGPAEPTVEVRSVTVPWAGAVFISGSPARLQVAADVDRAGCGVTQLTAAAQKTSSTITVTVVGHVRVSHDPRAGCSGAAHDPVNVSVALPAGIGDRTLVDAAGHTHPVLNASTVPTLPAAPTGYMAGPLTWNEQTGLATRTWTDSDATIALRYGALKALTPGPNQRSPLGSTTVRGTKATIYGFPGDDSQRTLLWAFDPSHGVALISDAPSGALSVPALRSLAESIR